MHFNHAMQEQDNYISWTIEKLRARTGHINKFKFK
jgi:hypothetical protein